MVSTLQIPGTRQRVATPTSSSAKRARTEELHELWREYKRTGEKRTRDRLVLTLAPLVKFIVYRKIREMPARVEAEDFISVGLEAMIQSIDRYDPEKGATLEQYSWTRIHGAVLDEMRRQDWAPRSVRRWERDIEKAVEDFNGVHGRRPNREELSEALGIDVKELRRRRDEIARSEVTSLNAVVLSDDETDVERLDTIASDDPTLDPEAAAGAQAAKERFREVFADLPQREREIAVLLYVKNLTLAEIGDILGVSESRVCQIHGQTKKKLRTSLADDAALFHLVA
jgi:RNA polymerase sigma factor for flagellar operon FliA